ncbi:MAG TPA: tetratricopeptide repeat protein [Vulgatibacter sp.]
MNRSLALLLTIVAMPAWADERPAVGGEGAEAAPAPAATRPAVDREAIDDALHVGAERGYASPNAYRHYLRGRLAEANGEIALALEELRQALAFDPESAELHAAAGWLLARTGSLRAAAAEAQRAIRLDPGRWDAHLLLGKVRVVQQRKADAAASLRRAIELAPGEAESYVVLARLLARSGDDVGAEAVARALADVEPGNGEAWRALANAATERGRPAAYRRYLQRAVQANPRDLGSALALALAEEAQGRHEDAARRFEGILEREPEHADALLGAARMALARKDRPSAEAFFAQLVGTAADPSLARLRAGEVWVDAGFPDEALPILDGAPEDPRLAYAKGLLLEGMARFPEAAEAFGTVPEGAGDLAWIAAARRASCLSRSGAHDDAITAMDRALAGAAAGTEVATEILSLAPEVFRRAGRSGEAVRRLESLVQGGAPAPAVALARALEDAGRGDEALEVLSDAVRRLPGDEMATFALASARERRGDLAGAVALMQDFLRANPGHPHALNFIGYVWVERGIRLEEARRMILEAVKQRPQDPAILDSLGWCEVKRGEARLGSSILERAARLAPNDPEILHHLAEAYARSARGGEAVATWSRAIEALDRDPDPRLRAAVEEGMRAARRSLGMPARGRHR